MGHLFFNVLISKPCSPSLIPQGTRDNTVDRVASAGIQGMSCHSKVDWSGRLRNQCCNWKISEYLIQTEAATFRLQGPIRKQVAPSVSVIGLIQAHRSFPERGSFQSRILANHDHQGGRPLMPPECAHLVAPVSFCGEWCVTAFLEKFGIRFPMGKKRIDEEHL